MKTPIDYNRKWAERHYKLPIWLRVLALPITFPHEMMHYLVGRLLRLDIKRFELHVSYTPSAKIWKNILMLMAPTALGTFIIVGAFQIDSNGRLLADCIFIYGFAMLMSSAADWYSVAKEIIERSALGFYQR